VRAAREFARVIMVANAKMITVSVDGKVKAHALEGAKALKSSGAKSVVFVGVGMAVSKTVATVEMVKRAMKGLHQCTSYSPVVVTDTKDGKTKKSKATQIRIELSTTAEGMDTGAPGYQAPKSRSGSATTSPRKPKAKSKTVRAKSTVASASPKQRVELPLKKKIAKAFKASTNRQATPTA
jgi:DNA-binding protein